MTTALTTTQKKIAIWAGIFIASFFVELYLESKNLVDSIGLWYTVYVSLIVSTLLSVILFVLISILKKTLNKKREG